MVENLQLELMVRREREREIGWAGLKSSLSLQQVKQDRDNLSQQVPGTPLAGECKSNPGVE